MDIITKPIDETSILKEVALILSSTARHPARYIEGIVHILEPKKLDVLALKVLNWDIVRDYQNNFADEVSITAVFPRGTYFDVIFPNKENIEFTLRVNPVVIPIEGMGVVEQPIEQRFKAKIKDGEEGRISPDKFGVPSTASLDISNAVTVEFQLLDKAVYLLRLADVGTIIRNSTVKDALLTLLTHQLNNIDISAEEKLIGVDLIEPDNQAPQEQIVIPHGTPLIAVPDHIQKNACGVYTTGIGNYIQHKVWYIYPRYNLDRPPKASRLITIIVVPQTMFPHIDRSWIRKGDHFKILCTGELSVSNLANSTLLNLGSGLKYTSSVTPMTTDYPIKSDNKAELNHEDINTYKDNKLTGKEILSPYRRNAFTANAFNQFSNLSPLNHSWLTAVWNNSYPVIIEPGTIVEVMYLDKTGTVSKLKGLIMNCQHSWRLDRKGLISHTWKVATSLGIWVTNHLENQPPVTVKGAAEMFISGKDSTGGGVGGAKSLSLSQLFGRDY